MALWRVLMLLALLTPNAANTFDQEAYCAGWCRGINTQDGIYRHGQCFCGSYYPIKLDNKTETLYRPRLKRFGYVPED